MNGEYFWKSGIIHYNMQLLLDGAIALYEEEATSLLCIAQNSQRYETSARIEAMGTALYALRKHVYDLEKAHREELYNMRK